MECYIPEMGMQIHILHASKNDYNLTQSHYIECYSYLHSGHLTGVFGIGSHT